MYHGWNDQLISPRNSINYYTSVVDTLGGAEHGGRLVRLFMVPGMNHCAGGDGPNTFDPLAVLEQWVEQGKAPERMRREPHQRQRRRSHAPAVPVTRRSARYTGSGSTDDAANFVCKAR